MRKTIVFLVISVLSFNFCLSQEWMTSLEVAKRLARVQNKMLFVMWEESTQYDYPVSYVDENGVRVITDLFKDSDVNRVLWEHFIPVRLFEFTYSDLYEEIKDVRDENYIRKFQDDEIKIMDSNGNILNVKDHNMEMLNISRFIKKYSLNTSFIQDQLNNYNNNKSFYTSLTLASKYLDYAIFVDPSVRSEIVELSTIYFDEALRFLDKETIENKAGFKQKCELLQLKGLLLKNRPKKVLRLLKKIDSETINEVNEPLIAFLNYTALIMKGDEKKASLWKTKVSLVDLKKAHLILNIKFQSFGNNH